MHLTGMHDGASTPSPTPERRYTRKRPGLDFLIRAKIYLKATKKRKGTGLCGLLLTSNGVLEASVGTAAIHEVARAQLLQPVQSLELRRVYQPQDDWFQRKTSVKGVLRCCMIR